MQEAAADLPRGHLLTGRCAPTFIAAQRGYETGCKRHAQDNGADYLLLLVDTSNERAICAYRATGFELGDQYGLVPMVVRYK